MALHPPSPDVTAPASGSDRPRTFGTIAIVGVGLLGGSLGRAVKSRGLARRVVGVGRNLARLEEAREAGVIDVASTDIAAAAGAELVVVCTPVDRLAADVIAAARGVGERGTVTDVGSIKGAIVRDVERAGAARTYVPAHPLAGSEQAGWEAGSAALFERKLCVLTPIEATDPARVDLVDQMWQGVGMRTARVSPEEHDRLLALTSHLPHVAAAALAALLGDRERSFSSTGFRDTTRIASGDPSVWTPILLGNAAPVRQALGRFERELAALEEALAKGDEAEVTRWLARAKASRDALGEL
jgi:prephenate dehydrogenase